MPKCRFCGMQIEHSFVDLGMSPLCQTHILPAELNKFETFYPLHAFVCTECWLVQLDEFVSPEEIFSDYDYFSSFSTSWVEHAKKYSEKMTAELALNESSLVVEVASNDGYLLQHFVGNSIPVLGIEPAANVADAAVEKGIRTTVRFFGECTAESVKSEFGTADLLLGNNVLAHVPDINDFVRGMKILLSETGTITMEFPHLLNLIQLNQFDTIYHEHFSYLSFYTVQKIFAHHGITLFDVEEIPTHGGSLRIYGKHDTDDSRAVSANVKKLIDKEVSFGINDLGIYKKYEEQVKETKRKLLSFLIEARNEGKTVVGYGAPGKGNTLLNYCAIRQDFLDYTVDLSTQKQGKFTPGCRLPILDPSAIKETKPDYVLVLPWNLIDEISRQHSYISEWGGKFVVPIPEVKIID
ncbi:MAG TPA: methyltransferase domain-containing protein [Gammaproteobacteria bacterium]|nr:methyltransferase domain-containing protein [Gammaproteobacteria bacterium]